MHNPHAQNAAVGPLRPRPPHSEFTVAFRMAVGAWAAVVVVMSGIAAVVAFNYDAVRNALKLSIAANSSGATNSAISDTVTVTLLVSGVAAVLLVLLVGLGLAMTAATKAAARIVLLVAGLATIGASILFRSFMSDAGAVAAGALRWGPLVCAGFAAIATVSSSISHSQR